MNEQQVPAGTPGEARRIRRWALVAAVAHVAFVLSWLVAASWQGPRYSVAAHSISDLYAVGAPGGGPLAVVLTLCGAAAIAFAGLSLWPALRPAGWSAGVGSLLLALSIFGLGDLLSPLEREACRRADPGCSAADQVANAGGALDATLSGVGLVLLVGAGFFLAAAMGRLPAWRSWAGPTRWVTVAVLALFVATGALSASGVGGLLERLLAAVGAAGIVALALGVRRRAGTAASAAP